MANPASLRIHHARIRAAVRHMERTYRELVRHQFNPNADHGALADAANAARDYFRRLTTTP